MRKLVRSIYHIEGIVQGVGFRPRLYCLAEDSGLGGWIKNCSGMVELALDGEEESIKKFIEDLHKNIPNQARIDSLNLVSVQSISSITEFTILESDSTDSLKLSIPADLAMCDDCKKEIKDPGNRRYHYPFTTCVNCGPRYTVVNSMPYDRCRTTLDEFLLCKECNREYKDPRNRRYHAESIACSVCGPELSVCNSTGTEIVGIDSELNFVSEQLCKGKIVAIRGIGGFLLAANALDTNTVQTLRSRKNRPDKPFAVMARDVNSLRKYCHISLKEEELLKSSVSPIVICKLRSQIVHKGTFKLISPNTETVGVMIPYTPVHEIMFENENIELLIMTSGNRGGEPIAIKNREAIDRLYGIADYFLLHNREINLRNDDSLCIIDHRNSLQVWRRARGFAPESIRLNFRTNKCVLGLGAELKNNTSLLIDDYAVVSPHIGDLETPEAVDSLVESVQNFPEFFKRKPDIIVTDKHPNMHSTRIGVDYARRHGIKLVQVQHHFAHAVSCMYENSVDNCFALIFDGTGLGDDGNIWGAELLFLDNKLNYRRLGTFTAAPLPGGDMAVMNPKRQLAARLIVQGIPYSGYLKKNYNISSQEYDLWTLQIEKNLNSPKTHAAGRLFDSYSALLGISPEKVTYEGQAAIKLEALAHKAIDNKLSPEKVKFELCLNRDFITVNWGRTFTHFIKNKVDLSDLSFFDKSTYALGFHYAVAQAAEGMIDSVIDKYDTCNVVLSGGVFMNRILSRLICEKLEDKGLNCFTHSLVPTNDGGISFGQAVIGAKLNGAYCGN